MYTKIPSHKPLCRAFTAKRHMTKNLCIFSAIVGYTREYILKMGIKRGKVLQLNNKFINYVHMSTLYIENLYVKP